MWLWSRRRSDFGTLGTRHTRQTAPAGCGSPVEDFLTVLSTSTTMESVAKLRSRLDEISSAIDSQKQVLRDLEKSKSQVQCQLNSVLDPVARLPLEIASEIFLLCTSTDIPLPDPRVAPMILLTICHIWRDIALATPALWAAIHIQVSPHGSMSAGHRELCETWINRARTLPLSLRLTLRGSKDWSIESLVKQHQSQLQSLELFVQATPGLEWTGPFPSLKKLTISAVGVSEDFYFDAPECIDILRAAPELLECDLEDITIEEDNIFSGPSQVEPLTHSRLQHLRLGNANDHDPVCSASILQCLTLPALKSLDITQFDIHEEALTSFFTRSSPPLESLRMTINRAPIESFRLLPSLTTMQWYCPYRWPEDDTPLAFLDMLGTADDFLPNLSNLMISILPAYFCERTDSQKVIRALTARASHHTPLQFFRLNFLFYDQGHDIAPDPEVILSLRQLSQNGMHIHVGPEHQNLV